MRITNEDIGSYQLNGFLIIKNLIQKKIIEDIKEDAENIFRRQLNRCDYSTDDLERNLYLFFKEDQEGFINCGKHIQHLISLHKLSLSDTIIDILKKLGLETPNICTRPTCYFNSKYLAVKDVYHTVPPHQDWKSMQGSLDSMVVWLPLVKVDKKLGALEVVPKSHKMGLLTTHVEDSFGMVGDKFCDNDFVSVELEVGDALFFSSFLVHRSGQNETESIRWSCHMRYNNLDDEDFISRKFPHPYIYKSKIND